MAKRSGQHQRKARDFYPTPKEAVWPLKAHLAKGVKFGEPFAGNGAIAMALDGYATCAFASDIKPLAPDIQKLTIEALTAAHLIEAGVQLVISNTPWPSTGSKGEPVIGYIKKLAAILPTWLLLPFDFAANVYFQQVSSMCVKIVPIGRVSWEGNGVPGKDNAAWFLFDANHTGHTRFHHRPKAAEYE